MVEGIIFVPREKWGALPPKGPGVPMKHPILFLTCCFCDELDIFDEKMVKKVQVFHMDGKGYNDIDCNFMIGRDGKVYEGRGWHVQPEIHNNDPDAELGNYLNVGFIGRIDEKRDDDPKFLALERLLQYAIKNNYLCEHYAYFGEKEDWKVEKNTIDLDREIQEIYL